VEESGERGLKSVLTWPASAACKEIEEGLIGTRVGEQCRNRGEEEGNEVKGTHSAVRDQKCELRRAEVEGRLYPQERGRNGRGIRPAWR
jgi:hypothetical protein